MTKRDAIRILASTSGLTPAEAADQLDREVARILQTLRRGRAVKLPGLGTFTPGATPRFRFAMPAAKPGPKRGKR